MILSGQTIWALCNPPQVSRRRPMLDPFHERTRENGMTFGLGPAGYDVRIKQALHLAPGEFALASTIERFAMPNDVLATVMDKSTWARRGLSLFNTVIEPGWEGWLTLELVNQSRYWMKIEAGSPIAQVIFQRLDRRTCQPYAGKFQMQENRPVGARLESEPGKWVEV